MTDTVLTPHGFDDLTLGQRATLERLVTAAEVEAFAVLSGDVNPIHLDEAYAASTRFGGRIAHGLYTASLISTVLGTRLPGPGVIYVSQTLRFLAPVRIGARLAIEVEIVDLVRAGRRCRLACRAAADGVPVLEGEAEVMVPARAVTLPARGDGQNGAGVT